MLYEIINNPMQLGKLSTAKVIGAYVPAITLVPFYCYYMAVSRGEEKPYPAATITSTACHYPQDIYFRYYMLLSSSCLALTFFILFKWMVSTAKKCSYPESLPTYLFPICQFSILLFGVTIGTIDGKSTGKLHSPCAVGFFLILIVAIVEVTLFLTNLHHWDTRTISKSSLFLKQILAAYLVAVWVYCLIMIIIVSSEDIQKSKSDKYVVIVEWNTVTFGLLWILTWINEWKSSSLCLIAPKRMVTAELTV